MSEVLKKIDTLLEQKVGDEVIEEYLLRNDLSYFAERILDMEIVDHHKEWSDLVANNKRTAINAPRDHVKSYFFCFAYAVWRAYFHWIPPDLPLNFRSIPRISLGYVFSNTQDQAIKHLEIIKNELEANPKLHHLVPVKKENWSKQEIRLANGAIIRARGWGVSVRGAHPVWVICDDVLNEENLYSEITRRKEKDYLFSAVTPMLVPGGQLTIVGCVTPDTYVVTKNGPAKIGDLGPDNLKTKALHEFNKPIYGENGFNTATKYWVNGNCETKKIRTRYGLELEASHRHPIRVQKGKSPRHRKEVAWRRMDELSVGDLVQIDIGQGQYGDDSDPELAYFMGLWTAEGSSEECGRLTFCTADEDLILYLKSKPLDLDIKIGERKHRIQSKVAYDLLDSLGVVFKRAEHKVVPKWIFGADRPTQGAFIRGFADGDGCSYINKSIQQINLASASKELILGLRALLMNMGIMPSYLVKPPGVSKLVKGKFDSHQLVISGGYAYKFMNEIGFTVSHKVKKFRKGPAPKRFLAGIKSIEDGDAYTVDFVIPKDHSFCSNGMISHNTPFHNEDLYSDLAQNTRYIFRRYQAVDENFTKSLWPTRYPPEHLRDKREEIGSTRFTREYLCVPISDENSLFPERIVKECFDPNFEMPTITTPDMQSRLQIFTGVDLAMSATVGADFTVITTIGVDAMKNRWLLDIRRKKGLGMTEQLREIEDVHRNFKPQKILIEDNSFQRVFKDELVKRTDMPVQGFTTTAYNKNSLEKGVPSLQILFENKKFVIARKTERDRRITDVLVHELRCFTWVDGKLQGLGSHDDTVMSLWMANEAAASSAFSFAFA